MASSIQPGVRNGREQYRSPGSAAEPGGYLWPELRIGREADFTEAYEWDLFLNLLGRKNRRNGHALTLGEVACHYVTDVEMRAMILGKYPDLRRDRQAARKVYRQVATETKKYLRMVQSNHNELVLNCVYGQRADMLGKTALSEVGPKADGRWMTTMLRLRPPGTAFRGYDGNKLGIDLSLNRELYEERREILDYLKQDQEFDVSPVRTDWEPHAAIFITHPHLSVDRIMPFLPAEKDTPKEMPFEAPIATSQNI